MSQISICICVHMSVCQHVCVRMCVSRKYMYTCARVCVPAYTCMHVMCMYEYAFTHTMCVCVNMYIHVHLCVHMGMCVSACVWLGMHVCLYMYVGLKSEKEDVKAVYCHPAYLTYMQSTSHEMPGWMKHKLETRLPGEISITSNTQMTPHLRQKAKKN